MKRMKTPLLSLLLIGLLALSGCKKEKIYTYGVDEVTVEQPGASKPTVKSDFELISIAYTDLFGTTIPPDKLQEAAISYQAFGDKRLVIDMLILNYLNDPSVILPSDASMRADLDAFVDATFRKFFVREPSAFERWYVADLIAKDATLTPNLVYYAFMTSNEYRFY
jgi:hypothetical protein